MQPFSFFRHVFHMLAGSVRFGSVWPVVSSSTSLRFQCGRNVCASACALWRALRFLNASPRWKLSSISRNSKNTSKLIRDVSEHEFIAGQPSTALSKWWLIWTPMWPSFALKSPVWKEHANFNAVVLNIRDMEQNIAAAALSVSSWTFSIPSQHEALCSVGETRHGCEDEITPFWDEEWQKEYKPKIKIRIARINKRNKQQQREKKKRESDWPTLNMDTVWYYRFIAHQVKVLSLHRL